MELLTERELSKLDGNCLITLPSEQHSLALTTSHISGATCYYIDLQSSIINSDSDLIERIWRKEKLTEHFQFDYGCEDDGLWLNDDELIAVYEQKDELRLIKQLIAHYESKYNEKLQLEI